MQQTSTVPDRAAIARMRARFAPVDIKADVASLAPGDRRALAKLVEAARIMDALFLRQVWAGNPALLQQLSREALAGGPDSLAAAQLHYFLINAGPWSRLDHHQPFVPGVPAKPERRQLLSGRRHQGGSPEVDRLAQRRRPRRRRRDSSP